MPSRDQFVDKPAFTLLISLSDIKDSPCLKLKARQFVLPNHRDRGTQVQPQLGIPPSELPTLDSVYHWVKKEILQENKTGFEAEMDKFLLGLVHRPRVGLQHEANQVPEQLLSNLLEMRCMSKVWSSKQLFFWRSEGPASPFDVRLASIQDSLRLLAGRRISELERNIVKDIEAYLGLKETSTLVMKWVLLWQMILIYRQSLNWMLEQQQTNAAPIYTAGQLTANLSQSLRC